MLSLLKCYPPFTIRRLFFDKGKNKIRVTLCQIPSWESQRLAGRGLLLKAFVICHFPLQRTDGKWQMVNGKFFSVLKMDRMIIDGMVMH
jgi:hypothetical protein